MYKRVSVVWTLVIVYLPEIKAKIVLRNSDNSNMTIENTVNHKLIYDDNSHFLVIFIEICVTVSILCAHTLMTNIYFILDYQTLKKTLVTHLIFMFRADVFFFFRILIT